MNPRFPIRDSRSSASHSRLPARGFRLASTVWLLALLLLAGGFAACGGNGKSESEGVEATGQDTNPSMSVDGSDEVLSLELHGLQRATLRFRVQVQSTGGVGDHWNGILPDHYNANGVLDMNADGASEFRATVTDAETAIFSGDDGGEVGRLPFSHLAPPLSAGDLDKDGIGDLVYSTLTDTGPDPRIFSRTCLKESAAIVSGRNGSPLGGFCLDSTSDKPEVKTTAPSRFHRDPDWGDPADSWIILDVDGDRSAELVVRGDLVKEQTCPAANPFAIAHALRLPDLAHVRSFCVKGAEDAAGLTVEPRVSTASLVPWPDADGDGVREIGMSVGWLCGNYDSGFAVLSGKSTHILAMRCSHEYPSQRELNRSIMVVASSSTSSGHHLLAPPYPDLNGDGILDVMASAGSEILVFSGRDAQLLAQYPFSELAPGALDFDLVTQHQGGGIDVVSMAWSSPAVATTAVTVQLGSGQGGVVWNHPLGAPRELAGWPFVAVGDASLRVQPVADLDGDGRAEILASANVVGSVDCSGGAQVLSGVDGEPWLTVRPVCPKTEATKSSSGRPDRWRALHSAAVLGDLDGDGQRQILLLHSDFDASREPPLVMTFLAYKLE